MAKHLLAALVTLLLAQLAGCSRQNATESGADPPLLGSYRATVALPAGEVPFGLELALEGGRYIAYLVNGSRRIAVPEVRVEGGRIEMRMPGYMNRISARIAGPVLEGEFVLVRRGSREHVIPFAARHGLRHRFWPESATQSADLAGRWAVTFTDQNGGTSLAVGEFAQRGASVVGTFLTPTSDHGDLAGEVHGKDFALSLFNGAWAFLYRGHVNERGEIEGTYWEGLAPRETFVGRRDANARVDNAGQATPMNGAEARLDFTFPDLDGRSVSLTDPRFAGKIVVVALTGSWCPSCHDEAAFLASYYAENRDRGVEVVALMFEHFGDFERAVAATRRFREKYHIDYTTLIAGTSEDDLTQRLPQLKGLYAVPATAFVDRQGRVRATHAGFSGPATGEHHQKLLQRFEALIDELLAEPLTPSVASAAH